MVIEGYKWLQVVVGGYRLLWTVVIGGYKWLQMVIVDGYGWFWMVIGGYRELQSCRWLWMIMDG